MVINMNSKKKKIVTLSAVAAVAAIMITGSTMAYFTDTKEATNTFTMGNVSIKLDEIDITSDTGERTEEGNDYSNLVPGQTVAKDPVIYNTGINEAYIRALVTVKDWKAECEEYFPDAPAYGEEGYENTLLNIADQLGTGWSIESCTLGEDENDVVFILKYAAVLSESDKTTAIFNKVTIPSAMESDDTFGNIIVTGQAIQANGFDSWEDAFAAFDGQE